MQEAAERIGSIVENAGKPPAPVVPIGRRRK
jgi:hypothetical protein